MSTAQCNRVREAVAFAKQRDTRVLVLLGGADFFSNGIHLNRIEAGAYREGQSAADESWQNINAMDDLALEVLTATDRITIAALRGNAGAGGVFLALAADHVVAHQGVVLNPHYKNMGNLYGSEYWTYLLPRRVGEQQAKDLMHNRLPLSAADALAMKLIDQVLASDACGLEQEVRRFAAAIVADPQTGARIAAKREQRERDEAAKPLTEYRKQELARMHRNFYGFDPSYHVARYHFVQKLPHAWTPRHLALHRNNTTRTETRESR
jgi:putative two-component system hydrogenase maturation factor HypX/HoxX